MVRGIFYWHTLGPLLPIEHRLNATAYLSIVADHIHHFFDYFVWPPLFSSTALTLLGMEFTRASQVLFHFSMTSSRSWWLLETSHSSTFHLRMPHLASPSPLPLASLASQWSSWGCVWGSYHVGILPCSPVSKGRGSCSASICHSTCWHS